jgi:hypothetical protein
MNNDIILRFTHTLRDFNARYGFRAPETFEYPEKDDLDNFREYAYKHNWYPLLNPTIEELTSIQTIVITSYPYLSNIVFITLLDDLYKQEKKYPESIISKEVVKFFRSLGFGTHIQFKSDHLPSIFCDAENCSETRSCETCNDSVAHATQFTNASINL